MNNLYKLWINKLPDSEAHELKKYSPEKIADNFSSELSFGTAGARELMEFGSNKINRYSIRRLTKGFFKFLVDKHGLGELQNKGIIIIHDNRYNGQEYTTEAASVFTKNKVKTYLYSENKQMPTPFGSAMVQKHHTVGAIVITASHNPKEYNGYKTYNEMGSQSTVTDTDTIVSNLKDIEWDFVEQEEINEDFIVLLNKVDLDYYINISHEVLYRKNDPKKIKLVYSPIHAVMCNIGYNVIEELGYDVSIVEKENIVDPSFGKMKALNPEDIAAYHESIKLAKKTNALFAFQPDPDGDRCGMVVFNPISDNYEILTSNKMAIILLYYLCYEVDQKNDGKYIINNFVSDSLIFDIAKANNMKTASTPVGPKWITEYILDNDLFSNYLFGYEESCGFLINDKLRDKDSLQAVTIFAEIFNYYNNKHNFTPLEILDKIIFPKFGFLEDKRINFVFKDSEKAKIASFVNNLRSEKLTQIGNIKIKKTIDYLNYPIKDHKNNLLKYYFGDQNNWFCIRPSGTEPKLKVYINVVEKNKQMATIKIEKLTKEITNFISKELKK